MISSEWLGFPRIQNLVLIGKQLLCFSESLKQLIKIKNLTPIRDNKNSINIRFLPNFQNLFRFRFDRKRMLKNSILVKWIIRPKHLFCSCSRLSLAKLSPSLFCQLIVIFFFIIANFAIFFLYFVMFAFCQKFKSNCSTVFHQ